MVNNVLKYMLKWSSYEWILEQGIGIQVDKYYFHPCASPFDFSNTIFVYAQIGGSHEENIYIEFTIGMNAVFIFTEGLRELLNNEDIY
ncbi:hypothetical protein [Paenibacillus aestuarii]|uniref:Uncharacterized protein n=1 Tax=Paenibacillus aestuarii TaxID=516965 RepID=A0ABW0KIT9_9BACL|nr:hypothetical protein [Paenibacillus aestuarii]